MMKRQTSLRAVLFLIAGMVLGLSGCELLGSPDDAPPGLTTYVFRNQSGYSIDVLPAGGQSWDSVTLQPNGGIKTYELEIAPDELNFTWSNAQATNMTQQHEIDGSWSFTFENAIMYAYHFYNASGIHVRVAPTAGQVWGAFVLLDRRWSTYNELAFEAKYPSLSFTLEKYDTAVAHADDSIEASSLRVDEEMGYTHLIRDPL